MKTIQRKPGRVFRYTKTATVPGFPAALFATLLTLSLAGTPVSARAGQCPPEGYSRSQLENIKTNDVELLDDQALNALAKGLMACLADPDPMLRDGVAFEVVAKWLREKKLQPATVDVLYQNLMRQVADTSDSGGDSGNGSGGFQQPFAALLLSEVARTDRVEPTFTAQRRAEMVNAAAGYLSQVNDYRGFSETEGWRHGVAHGSDWVLQLVLNENINVQQVELLISAVADQVSPEGGVFYIYGEPGRLARAVFYAHRKGVLSDEAWQIWLDGIADPAPFAAWNEMYSSQAGLAKRHNTLEFLNALYVYANFAEDEQGDVLAGQVMTVIKKIM